MKIGRIGCAIYQATFKQLPGFFFFRFNILIFIYYFKYETIETHARAFLPLIILSVDTVNGEKSLFVLYKMELCGTFTELCVDYLGMPCTNSNLSPFVWQSHF